MARGKIEGGKEKVGWVKYHLAAVTNDGAVNLAKDLSGE
jgi:hypothetical protein